MFDLSEPETVYSSILALIGGLFGWWLVGYADVGLGFVWKIIAAGMIAVLGYVVAYYILTR
jgi:hypothetical protein